MIDHLDHLVLTSTQPDATIDFYTRVLGMQLERFGEGRIAFRFGNQKINLRAWAGVQARRTCRCRARWICASSPRSRSTR